MYAASAGGVTSGENPRWASQCIRCGKCEEHCPQHIPIMDTMTEVHKDMEGPLLQGTMKLLRPLLNRKKS